jgi:GET complex subunit GET2
MLMLFSSPDAPTQPASHADPDEVDISQHFYEPKTTSRSRTAGNASPSPAQQSINDDQLRQMMLGFDPSSTPPQGGNPNPFAGFPGMDGVPAFGGMGGMQGGPPGADDPMMKMLQQMMGGIPGEGARGMPSFPGMPNMPMPGQDATSTSDPYAYIWRIIHAVFALGLGLYIAFTTTFTGTRIERERSGLNFTAEDEMALSPASVHFFWIFATAEVLLQTSRFFLEKGRVQQGGIIGMIMGFLPEPYKGYLALVTRYSRIWTTISGDAMVCVFVLGGCAWLRGS